MTLPNVEFASQDDAPVPSPRIRSRDFRTALSLEIDAIDAALCQARICIAVGSLADHSLAHIAQCMTDAARKADHAASLARGAEKRIGEHLRREPR